MIRYIKKSTDKINLNGRLTPLDVVSNINYLSQVTFEITENCNLACRYCAYGKFYTTVKERTNLDIPFKYITNVLDYVLLHKEQGSSLHIGFYGGEPLLKIDTIKQAIAYAQTIASNKNINLTFGLTTNAVLLKEHIDFFAKYNFQLLISLDGNKYGNSFRIFNNGKESFDVIYNNLKYVKENYTDYYIKNINFNAVYHQRNSVEELKNFFKEHFDKEPSIASIDVNGLNPLYQKEFMQELHKSYSEELNGIKSYKTIEGQVQQNPYLSDTLRFLKNSNKFFVTNYNDFFPQPETTDYIPTATCLPFSKRMFVTVKGEILPCERVNYKYFIGRVTEKGVEMDFERIAQKYNNYYDKIIKQCNVCAHKYNCRFCMLQIDMDADNSKCPEFEAEKKDDNIYNKLFEYIEEYPKELYRIMYEITDAK